jgi:hypothetical protein
MNQIAAKLGFGFACGVLALSVFFLLECAKKSSVVRLGLVVGFGLACFNYKFFANSGFDAILGAGFILFLLCNLKPLLSSVKEVRGERKHQKAMNAAELAEEGESPKDSKGIFNTNKWSCFLSCNKGTIDREQNRKTRTFPF